VTSAALLLVLSAALFHAVWNAAAKGARGSSYVFVWLNSVGSAVLCLPLALVQLGRAGWPWDWTFLAGPVVSGVLHIVYSLVLQTGYQRAELGVVYPVARGVGPLLTMLVALLVLGERPGLAGVVGAVVVLAGILVVATGNRVAHRDRLVQGLVYGTATGVAIASYTLWDNHAVVTWGMDPLIYFAFTITTQAVLLAPGAVRRRAHWQVTVRTSWPRSAVVAVLSPLAYVLVLIAMQTTPVSLVAPVRESSIVIGSLLAWWLYREPNPVRRLIGAVVVLVGIGMIAAG